MKIRSGIAILLGCVFYAASLPAQDTQPNLFEDKLLPALFQKEIQVELELVEDQKVELKQQLDSLLQRKNELGEQLRDFQRSGATEEVGDLMR